MNRSVFNKESIGSTLKTTKGEARVVGVHYDVHRGPMVCLAFPTRYGSESEWMRESKALALLVKESQA